MVRLELEFKFWFATAYSNVDIDHDKIKTMLRFFQLMNRLYYIAQIRNVNASFEIYFEYSRRIVIKAEN